MGIQLMGYAYEKPVEDLWVIPLIRNTKNPVWSARRLGLDPKLNFGIATMEDYRVWSPSNQLMFSWMREYDINVGALTGRERNGKFLWVADIDPAKKLFDGSVKKAREWRKSRIKDFQNFQTRISLTPSGGVHFYFYSESKDAVYELLRQKSVEHGVKYVDLIDIMRGENQLVVIPPSIVRLPHVVNPGSYFWMDEARQPIRELTFKPERKEESLSEEARGFRALFG